MGELRVGPRDVEMNRLPPREQTEGDLENITEIALDRMTIPRKKFNLNVEGQGNPKAQAKAQKAAFRFFADAELRARQGRA